MTAILQPEFSRITLIDEIPEEGITLTLEATAPERAALARRFDVLAIDSLTAEVFLRLEQNRSRVNVSGRLRAGVVQRCVVTLDPMAVDNDVSFERVYATTAAGPRAANRPAGEVVLTLDQDDLPEPLPGDVLDVGETVAEEFGLALDPFPRAAGAVFEGYTVGPYDQRESSNPFSALASHRSKIEKKG
jgi:uncharacterized metal-binding protein YceD (DUF177 family)